MHFFKQISERVVLPFRWRLTIIKKRLRYGGPGNYCPVCDSHVREFQPYAKPARPQQCGVCGALERHRLIWLFFRDRTDLFDGREKKMLHIAPEKQISRNLRRIRYIDYLSVDLGSGAMAKMDITGIHMPDNSFDVIYCSHVLEHIPDDRKAMSELRRILKPGGWAILDVPIAGETTEEDLSVTSPKERERLYGQWDHVRMYGRDFKNRLENAGFLVEVDETFAPLLVSNPRTERMGLPKTQDIHVCRKAA